MFKRKISVIIELRMKARFKEHKNSNYYKKYLIWPTKAPPPCGKKGILLF